MLNEVHLSSVNVMMMIMNKNHTSSEGVMRGSSNQRNFYPRLPVRSTIRTLQFENWKLMHRNRISEVPSCFEPIPCSFLLSSLSINYHIMCSSEREPPFTFIPAWRNENLMSGRYVQFRMWLRRKKYIKKMSIIAVCIYCNELCNDRNFDLLNFCCLFIWTLWYLFSFSSYWV